MSIPLAAVERQKEVSGTCGSGNPDSSAAELQAVAGLAAEFPFLKVDHL
jgi:hypothetical protein